MAVIKKEAYFISSTSMNKIYTNIWTDDEVQPKAVFQIAHGVAEHIGRYDDFARFLASKGFVVCGNDHLADGQIRRNPEHDPGHHLFHDGTQASCTDLTIDGLLSHCLQRFRLNLQLNLIHLQKLLILL